MTLGRFLHALGLPGIGPELATSMARVLSDAEGMLDWLNDAHALPETKRLAHKKTLQANITPITKRFEACWTLMGVGEIVALQFP